MSKIGAFFTDCHHGERSLVRSVFECRSQRPIGEENNLLKLPVLQQLSHKDGEHVITRVRRICYLKQPNLLTLGQYLG